MSDDDKGDDCEVGEEDKEEDDDTVEEEKEDKNICEYIKFRPLHWKRDNSVSVKDMSSFEGDLREANKTKG